MDEIAADDALRVYGAALAMVHAALVVWWRLEAPLDRLLAPGLPAICWPFAPNCDAWRVLEPSTIRLVLWIYLALSLATIAAFLFRRVALAWTFLLLLTIAELAIVLQDFRLSMNQHLMMLTVSVLFLFVPEKRRLLRYQIALFYFWAGTLKLNREWLSGAALYGSPLGLPDSLLPAACTYAAALELVGVWGLFAKRTWIFWATLAQLALFHLASYSLVGFLYPLVMLLLLSIFVLARGTESLDDAPNPLHLLAEPLSTRAALAVLSLFQVLPWLLPGDTAITGEGRLLALHMFDAKVVCEARLEVHRGVEPVRVLPLRESLPIRIQCDPAVYFGVAHAFCRHARDDETIDLFLRSRRTTEPELRPVIELHDVCRSNARYTLLGHNPWILTSER